MTVSLAQVLAIAIGGALGAVGRFWCVSWVTSLVGKGFPWGTLAVNVIGSFMIGIMYVVIMSKLHLQPEYRAILVTGFLGAFTTFSTFSLEAFELLQKGALGHGLAYIGASVILCILAVWAGISLVR